MGEAVTTAAGLNERRVRAEAGWWRGDADLRITVGMGTCGLAAGAADSLAAIEEELDRRELTAEIRQVGCVGMCSNEPMVELQLPDGPCLNYGNATAANICPPRNTSPSAAPTITTNIELSPYARRW